MSCVGLSPQQTGKGFGCRESGRKGGKKRWTFSVFHEDETLRRGVNI